MKDIKVYSKSVGCNWCNQAKMLLNREGLDYQTFEVDHDEEALHFIKNQGISTVPAIFIDGEYIGGYKELVTEVSKCKQ